jgi:hypothetical protein
MKFSFLPIYLLIGILNNLHAQENQTNSTFYKNKYPENDVVITHLERNVEFCFNKTYRTIEVEEVINYHLLSLKPNAKIEIPIFFNDHIKINSTKISNGKLFKTEGNYHPEGIFHSDFKLCLLESVIPKSFETRIITVKKTTLDIIHYSTIPLGFNSIPVDFSKIEITYPVSFSIDFIPENTEKYNLQKSQKQDDENIIVQFSGINIPSFIKEKNDPPFDFITPEIYLIPRNYVYKDGKINFFNDLQDFYMWCKNKIDFTINDPEKLKSTVEQIIKGKTSDLDKIKAIYYWVQENIRYIAFEEGIAGYVPENAQNVLYNKYADCKGMANLLKTMLTIAGFDARMAWIGTNSIKINFSIPNLANSNHMICVLFYKSQKYFLDATNKYSCLGNNSEFISGRQILIENKENYILDTVPNSKQTENKISSLSNLKIQNQELTGIIKLNISGDLRSSFIDNLLYSGEDKVKTLEKMITGGSNKITVKDIKYNSLSNNDSILVLEAGITLKNRLSQIGNELILLCDPFDELSELTAPEDKKLDQYFNKRQYKKYVSTINIPSEYIIDKLPENKSFKNNNLIFNVTYSQVGQTITFTRELELYNQTVPRDQIVQWNEHLKKIKNMLLQPIKLHIK